MLSVDATKLKGKSRTELYFILKEAWLSGDNRTDKPKSLTVSDIKLLPDLYQPRTFDEEQVRSERHTEELSQIVKEGRDLDPITVFAIGNDFFCIDGHHRHKAYRRAKVKRKVPVRVYSGDFGDAWTQCLAENTKDRLPMRQAEKLEAAWNMNLIAARDGTKSRPTKAKIALVTGAGLATVKRMEKQRKVLVEQGNNPEQYTWQNVKDMGDNSYEPWSEERIDKQAAVWAARIGRAFGPKAADNPRIFARALMIHSEPFSRGVQEYLNEEYDDEIEDFDNEDDCDF